MVHQDYPLDNVAIAEYIHPTMDVILTNKVDSIELGVVDLELQSLVYGAVNLDREFWNNGFIADLIGVNL